MGNIALTLDIRRRLLGGENENFFSNLRLTSPACSPEMDHRSWAPSVPDLPRPLPGGLDRAMADLGAGKQATHEGGKRTTGESLAWMGKTGSSARIPRREC